MFMQRLEVPSEATALQLVPAVPNKPSRIFLIAFAGFLFIAVMTPITVLYWVLVALWVSVWAAVRNVGTSLRVVGDTINFAGRAITSG